MKPEIRDFGRRSFVRTKGLIERIEEEERKMIKCKHYGMNRYGLSSNGNQCPLKDGFAPCEMEVFWKVEPDWSKCGLNPEAVESGAAIIEGKEAERQDLLEEARLMTEEIDDD